MDMAVRSARVALVGNPNSGKTALFNALTGAHQKVANYAGVTVERKEGLIRSATGRSTSTERGVNALLTSERSRV